MLFSKNQVAGLAAISSLLIVSAVIAQSRPTSSNNTKSPRNIPNRTLSPLVQEPESRPGLNQEMPDMPENMIEIDDFPPVVLQTSPPSGTSNLPSGQVKLQVRFNERMSPNTWTWSPVQGVAFPELVDGPYFEEDLQTCAVIVNLEPDTIYGIWLNSSQEANFRDESGQAAIPYLFFFKTSGS